MIVMARDRSCEVTHEQKINIDFVHGINNWRIFPFMAWSWSAAQVPWLLKLQLTLEAHALGRKLCHNRTKISGKWTSSEKEKTFMDYHVFFSLSLVQLDNIHQSKTNSSRVPASTWIWGYDRSCCKFLRAFQISPADLCHGERISYMYHTHDICSPW